MEGYSVTEAASVLGVPTERVWELLARGVLSGAPEGETGMRVYLQPRPAPAPPQAKGPNGNGGTQEPERELSPFRELLTEFRNLTERYGQALLALGEARGEVASLRSRVDMLEARMDLRLPMGQPQAAGWGSTPMAGPVERAITPTAPDSAPLADFAEPASTAAEPSEDEEKRSRARGPRRATESFAEALARAEDPSPPELPGGAEAAAALAALRQNSEAGSDIGLPREVAGADSIPVANDTEAQTVAVASVVEAAPAPVEVEPEPVELEPEPVELEPEPVELEPELTESEGDQIVHQAGPTFEPAEEPVPLAARAEPFELEATVVESEPAADLATPDAQPELEPAHTDREFPAEPVPMVGSQSEAPREREPEPPVRVAPDADPASATVEPIAWDAARYTTDIEEPDWFAAEVVDDAHVTPAAEEPKVEAAVADAPQEQVRAEPEEEATADSEDADAAPEEAGEAQPPAAGEPGPGPSVADDVEPEAGAPGLAADQTDAPRVDVGEPAEGSGADEMEVAPTGGGSELSAAPAPRARPFPGAQDLDDAIAALRAAGQSAEPPPESEPAPPTELDANQESGWPARSAFVRPATPGTATRGPASRAYRRLRRIFPG